MLLENFHPQSKLITKTTLVEKPHFPAIDAHNHLGEDFGGGWDKRPLSELLDLLDAAGIIRYVDLDGGWGEHLLNAHLDHFKQPAPERFMIFGGVDWSQMRVLAPAVIAGLIVAFTLSKPLNALLLGEADAVIGWDVFARQHAEEVEAIIIPAKLARPRNIPASVIKWSKDPEAAKAFIDFLTSDEALKVWEEHGYAVEAPTAS